MKPLVHVDSVKVSLCCCSITYNLVRDIAGADSPVGISAILYVFADNFYACCFIKLSSFTCLKMAK